MTAFTLLLFTFSLVALVSGAGFYFLGLKYAPQAIAALTAQADAMVRERHAAELESIARARFQTAHALLEVVRRDRDIMLAARAAVSSQPSALSQEERFLLDVLRGYEFVFYGESLLFVERGFPIEQLLPGARKGALQ